MLCYRTPSSLMLIIVVFFCHESDGVWPVLSRQYNVIIINIHIYSIGQVIFFVTDIGFHQLYGQTFFLSSGMFIVLLGNWFLNYKWSIVIYNKQWVLKDQVFASQFLTLIRTAIAKGLLSTATANRMSKVQNNSITEEDIIEHNRVNRMPKIYGVRKV